MITFNIDFPSLVWLLTGASIIMIGVTLLLMRQYMKVGSQGGYVPTGAPPTSVHPSLTVIVYASSDHDHLDEYLADLMSQDYDNYDVVLVYDAGASATAAVAEHYAAVYDRLYFTFIPPESHSLSRRKLAITLGVKAAKGDVVLVTTSNCHLPGQGWLSAMMEPFTRDASTEVVLGLSHMDFSEMHGAGKWYRMFDSVMTDGMWLGYAMDRHPYRGDGHNLAFMKRLFFEQKGFARTIDLEVGDDDLFVNDISDATNTAVVLSPDSILTTVWEESSLRIWREIKSDYRFTSRWLPKRPFLQGGALSLCQWIVAGCCVATAIVGLPDLLPLLMAVAVLLVYWSIETMVYRRVAGRLQMTGAAPIAIPLFMLWRPVGNLLFRMRNRRDKGKNFIWQGRRRHP